MSVHITDGMSGSIPHDRRDSLTGCNTYPGHWIQKDKVQWFNGASVAMALMFVVFFALGPGSIPWLIVAELFSQGSRSSAISVSVLVNWVANFCVGYGFPHMQKGLISYSFLPFTVLLVLFWIFVFMFLPETKGRTIEEISSTGERRVTKKIRSPDQKAIWFPIRRIPTAYKEMKSRRREENFMMGEPFGLIHK